jgi:hypothetical protein
VGEEDSAAAAAAEEEQQQPRQQLAPLVCMEDFTAAAVAVKPSVSPAELLHYEDLRRRFCSNPGGP